MDWIYVEETRLRLRPSGPPCPPRSVLTQDINFGLWGHQTLFVQSAAAAAAAVSTNNGFRSWAKDISSASRTSDYYHEGASKACIVAGFKGDESWEWAILILSFQWLSIILNLQTFMLNLSQWHLIHSSSSYISESNLSGSNKAYFLYIMTKLCSTSLWLWGITPMNTERLWI